MRQPKFRRNENSMMQHRSIANVVSGKRPGYMFESFNHLDVSGDHNDVKTLNISHGLNASYEYNLVENTGEPDELPFDMSHQMANYSQHMSEQHRGLNGTRWE